MIVRRQKEGDSVARVYFEGYYGRAYVKAEEWYTDGLVYVNVRQYIKSTNVSRPDVEKSFLLKLEKPERIIHYDHTISEYLAGLEEKRDADGKLIPIIVTLPEIDLCDDICIV